MLDQHEAWLREERPARVFRTINEVAVCHSARSRTSTSVNSKARECRRSRPPDGADVPYEAWELLIRQVEQRTVPADVIAFRLCEAEDAEGKAFRGSDHDPRQGLSLSPGGESRGPRRPQRLRSAAGFDPLDLGEAPCIHDNQFVGLVQCVALRRQGEDGFVEDEEARRAFRRETNRAIAAVHGRRLWSARRSACFGGGLLLRGPPGDRADDCGGGGGA